MPSLDALADAVAARLDVRRQGFGPVGEPDAELPPDWRGPEQLTFPRPGAGASLRIDGIEYTQSIQHHSVTTPRYEADNSIPLVAYKPMIVRVYPGVRRQQLGADTLSGRTVTGELVMSIGDRVIHRTEPNRRAGYRVGDSSDIDRTLWDEEMTIPMSSGRFDALHLVMVNCPLNFVVPAYSCRPGRIYVSLRIWPVDEGPMSSRTAVSTGYITFLSVRVPKVCLVRVNWTDSAGTRFSPTDAQMLGTLSLAERMLPFPYFEPTILDVEIESSAAFAMSATNGGCNVAWSNLVTELNVTRIFTALFQLGDIVYGMVPQNAIPAGATSWNSGCGRGAGGGFVSDGMTFAHELGHLYDRPHVAVPGDTRNDPDYPRYGGSATSIGEVGVDTGTSPPSLFDPAVSEELMSYGSNQWISPYTYRKILEARDMHQSAAIKPQRWRELFIFDFRLYREALTASIGETRVELRAAARIQAPGTVPPRPSGASSPVSVDLLDANRRVLATHHCTFVAARGSCCGCGCDDGEASLEREPWLDFTEVIEWTDQIAVLSFHQGGEPLAQLQVGEPPTVMLEGPERNEDTLTVRVYAEHPRERATVIVLFSNDGGETWRPVAYDPPDGIVTVSIDRLPGGERCSFRALATAELQTATAETEPFELPAATRRVWIDAPSSECPIAPGPVRIGALIDSRGLGPVEPQRIVWTSELDGELGRGAVIVPALSEGRHEIAVSLPDGRGGTLTERGIIIVSG